MPQNNNSNGKKFYTIIGGKITERASQNQKNAVERTNKNGKSVWELKWDSLNGYITSMEFQDHAEYGKSLVIEVNENGVECSLQLSCNSKYFSTFVNRIKAVNTQNVVSLTPYSFADKEKKKRDGSPKFISGISLYQDGKKIEAVVNRENQLKGQPVWNDPMDKVQLAQYSVDMEKAQVEYINDISIIAPDNMPKKKENIVFADFEDEITPEQAAEIIADNEEDVPF